MMLHGLLYLLSLIAVEGESLQVWNNGLPTSLRGIHVFTNEEVWVSGSAGYIGHTVNGGSDWAFRQIPGWESAEFRDIEKINDSTVLVMSSTLPAAILISEDNGLTFRTVYSSPDSTYFLDGMDCNSNGDCILYGDPIEGYMLLLASSESGHFWKQERSIQLPEGTAAFAASGSGIQWLDDSTYAWATGIGGALIIGCDLSHACEQRAALPYAVSAASGIYGMHFKNNKMGVVTGGDYTLELETTPNTYYAIDGGYQWQPFSVMPAGYRSSIGIGENGVILICGPGGIDRAQWGAFACVAVSEEAFHTLAPAPNGDFYLAGPNGNTGKYTISR